MLLFLLFFIVILLINYLKKLLDNLVGWLLLNNINFSVFNILNNY